MPSVRPAMHGRDHRAEWDPTRHRFVGGADPTPLGVFLGPSPVMGAMLPALNLANGFGTSGGVLWVPYREGVRASGNSVDTGETVEVAWSHADPSSNHFETVMARLHPIADIDDELDLSYFAASEPWESSPWSGASAFGYPGVGPGVALGSFPAPGGDWGGVNTRDWYGFMAISDDDADTITFSGPGGWSEAAAYTYSLSGAGTIGYIFHRFNSSSSTSVSVTFGSGTAASRSAGYIRLSKTAGVTPTVDADIGETEANDTVRPGVTLTGDVPFTSGVLVVGAMIGPEGWDPSDAHKRPDVFVSPGVLSNQAALYRLNGRNRLVTPYVGGLGQPGGTGGGGAPSGSAGGALDGTYPNPGLAASVAGAGLAESSDVLSVNVDNSTIEIVGDTLRVKDDGITAAKIAANAVTESEISLSDVTSDNVTSTAHGFAPKSPADSTKFLDGSATPAWDTVKDSDLSTSDITTNDVTTSKHGFVPKAPNDTTKFLRGDATWAVPAGGGGGGAVATDTIWDAKGDLAAGTGSDAASRLAVGTNGQTLVADSAETTGLRWRSIDGWIETADTWTFASATTFTISGVDRTTVFTPGTRLKLTQTTVKYFVVVSSTFSTDTTVTITGGSDYTFANAAVSANQYSYDANPQGWPGWFNYAPAATGFSSKTNDTARFSVVGRTCFVEWAIQGTSNATTLTFTLPIASGANMPAISGVTLTVPCRVTNSGTVGASPGRFDPGVSTTTATISNTLGGGAFTNSGTKGTIGAAAYEI